VWLMVGLVVATAAGSAVSLGRGRRIAAWVGVGSVVVLVGISRLYLAAHWLTDVLAGWALGTAWTLAVAHLATRRATPGV